jgi:hypothetical protein
MSDHDQDKPTSADEPSLEQGADQKSDATPPAVKRSWKRWLLPVAALVTIVALSVVLWGKLRDDNWAYYTDDEGLRVSVEEKKERMVLWDEPHQALFQEQPEEKADSKDAAVPDADAAPDADPDTDAEDEPSFNQASERVEAAFSADGSMMVLTRWSKDFEKTSPEETGADLYLSTWDGRVWSRPAPMADLNSKSNERGPAFSRDGKYLYFCSDRADSAGGYDIYVARRDSDNWTAVERLGDSVNSPQNETGPASSPDDKKLYFSTDRDSLSEAQDIFVAARVIIPSEKKEPVVADATKIDPKAKTNPKAKPAPKVVKKKAADAKPELPPVPVFAQAESVSNLNSESDDIEASMTGRGDHVFIASDRDGGEGSRFGLYLSRVLDGRVLAPQKVDVYIKEGNATDPAVRMEGFDLLFSSDADLAAGDEKLAAGEPGYRLYRSTTREVVGYTDLSNWDRFKQLMNDIGWWILLALLALIALIYLLEKWRDITDLFHRCLAASAILHLLLLMFLMYWLIAQAIEGGDRQSPDVTLSIDALAEEELAMESEQELAQVAQTTQLVMDKNVQEFKEMKFIPKDAVSDPIPVARRSSDQSLTSDFTPSKASAAATAESSVQAPKTDVALLKDLAPTELPALEVEQLEVAEVNAAEQVEPIDPTKDDFQRNEDVIAQIDTKQVDVKEAKNVKINVQSSETSVEKSTQPSPTTDNVEVVEGFEASDVAKAVGGQTAVDSLQNNLPGSNPTDALTSGIELSVKAVDPTKGDFKGTGGSLGTVKTSKANTGGADNGQVDVESTSNSVGGSGKPTPTTDTGGSEVRPSDGVEAPGGPPTLEGFSDQLALAKNLPGQDAKDSLASGVKFETPKHLEGKVLSRFIKRLSGKPSLDVIKSLGGSDATEAAIGRALDWFTRHQEADGHWDMKKHGGSASADTAGTGLALLCYYGHGYQQDKEKNHKHTKALVKALDWMVKQQKKNGDLRGAGGGNHGMYAHGIAAIALCEGYGLTKDPKLKQPAINAIDFILKAQHEGGGWRYQPGQPGDLSVTGWHTMALHSAQMADLTVPEEAFAKSTKFVTSVSGGKLGGIYGYTTPGGSQPAMVATGMFLRQLDLAKPTEPRMQESARFIKGQMIKSGKPNFYFDYYAQLALYQHQGPIWEAWNENLKKTYLAEQKKTGDEAGSWDPVGQHVGSGGRVLSTGLAVLSLEVYYRLLPMFGFGRDEAP